MTRKTIALALAVALMAAACTTAWACPSPTRPQPDSRYATIILAEVVGVRLTDYADARLRQIREGAARRVLTDASPAYEVELIKVEQFKGSAADRLTLKIPSACAIPHADLQLFGIFYVDDEGQAIPIYQDDGEYRDRLLQLNSRHTASCVTGEERFGPHPCWKPRAQQLECLTRVKDIAYGTRSSCPSGVQEFRERLHHVVLGRYDWQMPPLDPSTMR